MLFLIRHGTTRNIDRFAHCTFAVDSRYLGTWVKWFFFFFFPTHSHLAVGKGILSGLPVVLVGRAVGNQALDRKGQSLDIGTSKAETRS